MIDLKMKWGWGVAACLVISPQIAQAGVYHSDTDTGVDILDYIEWQQKADRQNAMPKELKDLKTETSEQAKTVDPKKNAPVTFEGDDISYNDRTGEIFAKGNVKITQVGKSDSSRLLADEITGNAQSADLHIEDKTHLLRTTEPRVVLDGYKTSYNYRKKTGTMEQAKGQVDEQHIQGEKMEFYPDEVVIYNGTMTKCPAKRPDYHISAEKIEIWPDQKIILHNAKFWIKNICIAKKAVYETAIGSARKEDSVYPTVKYNSDDGVTLSHTFEYPVRENVNAYAEINYHTKQSFKNIYGVDWNSKDNHVKLQYGYFEDSDDLWIKKEPTFIYEYGSRRLGTTPFSYLLGTEIGRWTEDGRISTHKEYYTTLSRDPIYFGKSLRLYTDTTYSITHESYDDSTLNSWSYNAVFVKDVNPKTALFSGYHYTQNTKANSVFAFDAADYAKQWESGISYRIDEKNRIVAGINYDLDSDKTRDVDYYWYHDMHCAEMIFRYREKRDSWHVTFQFTPW